MNTNTNKTFSWPQRKEICRSQLLLSQQSPTQTLVEGMPIEDYWRKQLEIALKHAPDKDTEPIVIGKVDLPKKTTA